ncbi:MAG: enoyl-CoA hydratase/isomerase family protein [Thermoprotei archaeon]
MSIESKIYENAYWIFLNRPEKLNAINVKMWDSLKNELIDASKNKNVRVIVISGIGRFFCAGEDIEDLNSLKSFDDALNLFLDHIRPVFELILRSPKPVMAAVNGPAYGAGVELILASDLAVAVRDSYFSLSQGRIGVGPALALVIGLPALGRKRLLEMVLTGRKVTAEEAYEWGMINYVVDKNDLEKWVISVVKEISLTTPLLARITKDVMMRQLSLIDYTSIFREIALFLLSEEARIGIKQFLEKH